MTSSPAPVSDSQSAPVAPAVVATAGNEDSPVSASLRLSRAALHPGDVQQIVVELQIKSGWHVYSLDKPTGIGPPTSIQMELPAGIKAGGGWTGSPPILDPSSESSPVFVYHGLAAFSSTLNVAGDLEQGSFPICVRIGYQACDRFSCRPFEELELTTEIRIVPATR